MTAYVALAEEIRQKEEKDAEVAVSFLLLMQHLS
jgi:hypothetical protein